MPPGQSVPYVVFLVVAVGLTFVVGCASVAGLLVGQLWTRRHELAIQAALGAPRTHVLWYAGTGIGLLSLLGGGAALALAHWLQAGPVHSRAPRGHRARGPGAVGGGQAGWPSRRRSWWWRPG